jgi:hypothetical protein
MHPVKVANRNTDFLSHPGYYEFSHRERLPSFNMQNRNITAQLPRQPAAVNA